MTSSGADEDVVAQQVRDYLAATGEASDELVARLRQTFRDGERTAAAERAREGRTAAVM